MTVPRLLVLTDRAQAGDAGHGLAQVVEAAFRAGAPAVVLRERDLPAEQRRRVAADLSARARSHGARLLVAGDVGLATAVGAAGVHLAAGDPMPALGGLLVGRSCHDQPEVAAARAEGGDYASVSPVASTRSKPGYGPALGADGLAALVDAADGMPVIALGGVTVDNLPTWLAVGAHGVAVMGAVMSSPTPERVVEALLTALDKETS